MRFVIYLFILFCFFPYIDIFQLGTDTQPNALLLGLVLLFGISDKRINAPLILLWVVFFLSISLVFFNKVTVFEFFKNTLNYLSPPLIATITYWILHQLKYKVSFKFFIGAMLTIAFVGLIQLFVLPDFGAALINMNRGVLENGRGVVSLFSEPAFYGTTCLFFMAFSLLYFSKRQNYIAIPLLIFQLVFISRSATAIAIFLLAFGLFVVIQMCRFKFHYLLGSVVATLLVSSIALSYWNKIEHTRAGLLAQTFIENPLLVTKIDGSVGIRFTGTVAPFLAMKHHYFMPQGLGYYREFLTEFRRKGLYDNFLTIHRIEKKPRLSGGINMVLYQLGFIGLIFPFAIYLAFRGQLKEGPALLAFLFLVVSMMTQIQMMNAMIGFVIGTAIYRGKLNTMEGKEDKIGVDSLGTN